MRVFKEGDKNLKSKQGSSCGNLGHDTHIFIIKRQNCIHFWSSVPLLEIPGFTPASDWQSNLVIYCVPKKYYMMIISTVIPSFLTSQDVHC